MTTHAWGCHRHHAGGVGEEGDVALQAEAHEIYRWDNFETDDCEIRIWPLPPEERIEEASRCRRRR